MSDPGVSEKLKVFISYSRRDAAEFADELVAGLEYGGFAPFLDRHDIAAGEDWEARLGGLIAQSDTVVFVVSPESVKSERCVWEVERTLGLAKRLLPVIHKPVPDADIPQQLSRLQFVRFDGRGLARPLAELAEALRLDLDWIREHTRLGELAARWQAREKPESLLLRGDDLDAAKAWAAQRKAGAPEVTEAQRAFLHASEEAESARLSKERAQLEEMRLAQVATARHQKRAARLLWGVAALVLAVFGYVTWQAYDVSRRELAVFTSLAAQAMKEGHFDRAMRYALQAYSARGSLPWLTPFSTELEGKLAGGAQSTRLHRLLKGHSGEINVAAYSPDGARILTASDDGTARIWDAESGAEIAALRPEAGEIKSAVFSPDGKRVALAVGDATARIWDITTGRDRVILKGHKESLKSLAFDPEGKRVVTASLDGTARIWDAESGTALAVLTGHTGPVDSAVFSASGRRVVTSSWDGTARVWDANDGGEVAILKGHSGWVRNAMFDHTGKRVLTEGQDGTARIWDAESGREITVLKKLSELGGGPFASVDARIWDADSGKEIVALCAEGMRRVPFDAACKRAVTPSSDNTVRIWDAESGKLSADLKGHTGEVRVAAFSPNGKQVVSASSDHTARIWDVEDGAARAKFTGHTESIYRATFSPDGQRVATASFDNSARIWDASSGREIMTLNGHTGAVLSARFDPLGKRVVTASADGTVRIWNAESGKEVLVLRGHTNRVESAAFDREGRRVVSTSFDGTARIWDAESGALLATVTHEEGKAWVRSGEFSPDGRSILTATDRGTVFIVDADPAVLKLIVALEGHTGAVQDAHFDREGKRVVTASWDGTARIWNAESGQEITRMTATRQGFRSAMFDPEGSRVVTASFDGTARIWDAPSGKEIAVLHVSDNGIWSAAFSPDGRYVLTASSDKTARIVDVTWAARMRGEALRERVCAEKLVGAAQEFTDAELDDPILRNIDKDDPVARNPCLRRGPLSLDYWTRLPGEVWRSLRRLAGRHAG
jgi:WD40 repeat protein